MKQAREMRCIGARRACPPSLNVKYQEALDTIKQIIAIMTTHLISIELFLLSAKQFPLVKRRACPPSLNVKYQEALDTIKQIIAIMTTHLISIELFLLSAKQFPLVKLQLH